MADQAYSNRSSVEPSSNPSSPSSSPAGTPSELPKKRTRASKPKVRTGCITWIRRVKCDEGKPACARCTSTGRTCDGYDKAALARLRSPDPAQAAEQARAEFVRACEWNEALRSMRRIEASIDGTDTERRLFARFRAATAEGAAAHVCTFTNFWRRLTPATGCTDEAIKHAVVALAAAYQLCHHPNEPVIDGFTKGDLDVLTIQHYNRSIERLQSHAASSAAESIRVTLVCCLAFISLETLRGNHNVAVTHLVNGLRILQSLPDSAFDCLDNGSVFVWRPAGDSLNMADIIQLFAQLELSAGFFTQGIQPVIADRGYRTRQFDDGARLGPFPDATHARSAMICFQLDAMARLHEIASVTAPGDPATASIFWSDPGQQRQQACLLARSAHLGALVNDFFSPARFGNPDPTTPMLVSLYLDLLYFRCAQFLLSRAAFNPALTPGGTTSAPPTSFDFDPNLDFFSAYRPPQLYPMAAMSMSSIPSIPTSAPAARPAVSPPAAADNDLVLLPSILHLAARLATTTPLSAAGLVTTTADASSSSSSNTPSRAPLVMTDLHTRLLGPLYLVARHAADEGSRGTAVRLLAESLCARQRRNSGDGSSMVASAAAAAPTVERMARVVMKVVVEDQQRRGGAVVGVEVPRALVGAGGLPSLWDALGMGMS